MREKGEVFCAFVGVLGQGGLCDANVTLVRTKRVPRLDWTPRFASGSLAQTLASPAHSTARLSHFVFVYVFVYVILSVFVSIFVSLSVSLPLS